jgi:hypothetical protein
MSEIFEPQNQIEKQLIDVIAGKISQQEFFPYLMEAKLFIGSVNPLDKDLGDFCPLIFDREGVPMAAVFTAWDRVAIHKDKIKDVVEIGARDLFMKVAKGNGIVINPGFREGLEILPLGIENLLKDF